MEFPRTHARNFGIISAMSKTNKNPLRSWLLVVLIALTFLGLSRFSEPIEKAREISQYEFYKALDDNKVVEPVVRYLDHDEGATYLTGEIETDEPLDANGAPKTFTYRVLLVPGENTALMEDLLNRQIKVEVKTKIELIRIASESGQKRQYFFRACIKR